MSWTAVLPLLVALGVHLLAAPLVGAASLALCARAGGLRAFPFAKLWKVYLAAVAYGLVLGIVLTMVLPAPQDDPSAFLVVQMAAVCLTQCTVVALMLGLRLDFRALLALGFAVGVTNLFTLAVLISLGNG
jgi:hypothetical protein